MLVARFAGSKYTPHSSMVRIHGIVADGIGVLVLAGLAGLVAWIIATVYTKGDAIWAWSIGFPLLAICGLLVWHSEKWPMDPQDVFLYGLLSVPAGFASFVIDALISTSQYPQLPFRYAIWHAGSPFGIVLTICICPGFTLVALAGTVRALILASRAHSIAENRMSGYPTTRPIGRVWAARSDGGVLLC